MSTNRTRALLVTTVLATALLTTAAGCGGCRVALSCETTDDCPRGAACIAGVCAEDGTRARDGGGGDDDAGAAGSVDGGAGDADGGVGADGGAQDADAGAADAGVVDGGGAVLQDLALSVSNPTSEALADFPLLVTLTSARIDYALASPTGDDVRFLADGAELAREIEAWNPAGTSFVWVRIPLLPANGAQALEMVSGAGPAAARSVWPAPFVAVYHLQAGGADASGNGHDGTPAGAPLVDVGQIAGAVDFLTGADRVSVPDAPPLDVTNGFTLSAWVAPADFSGAYCMAVSKGTALYAYYFGTVGDAVEIGVETTTPGAYIERDVAAGIAAGWHWLAATYDATSTELALYVDGAQVSDELLRMDIVPGRGDLQIGNDLLGESMRGGVDEARVESAPRSPAWIDAQFLSMTDQLVTYAVPP